MKCLKKSGCTCKTCKREIKFHYKTLVLSSKFSIEYCKDMTFKNKGFKYPKSPSEKESTSRQSMWSVAYLNHLYNKDEVRAIRLSEIGL